MIALLNEHRVLLLVLTVSSLLRKLLRSGDDQIGLLRVANNQLLLIVGAEDRLFKLFLIGKRLDVVLVSILTHLLLGSDLE